jgi:hypothetical protein
VAFTVYKQQNGGIMAVLDVCFRAQEATRHNTERERTLLAADKIGLLR